MSPQNSHRICRHAPQGGVSVSVSAATAMRRNRARAFGDRFEHRHALGAKGQAVGRVFDVAAGVDAAGVVFESGAHAEMRKRRVGVFTRGQRGGVRSSVRHSTRVTR